MEEQQTDGQKKLINSCCNTTFSLDMALHILLTEAACSKASNFVLSPFSIHSMLSLIAVGAKESTLERLLPILGSNSLEELNSLTSQINFLPSSIASPIVSFLNTAWVDQKFKLKPAFQKVASEIYSSTAKQVDFTSNAKEVADSINSWANQATKGLIKTLLPEGSLKEDTTLVLANALYFKGQWDRKFDLSRTQIKNFHLLNSEETVAIPFMTTKPSHKHLYKSFDGYKVLKIPYQNPKDKEGTETIRFAMNFFLPDAKDGLADLVNRIRTNPAMLSNHSDELLLQEENLRPLWIPRFKFSFEMEASETLKELGLGMVMNQGELTEMVDCCSAESSVAVSKIFHKACIEVNEEGTEAAATTAPRFVRKARRVNPPSFVADHAFVFTVVEERSGIVLFVGAVVNPLLAEGEEGCSRKLAAGEPSTIKKPRNQ